MKKTEVLRLVEAPHVKAEITEFHVGDTIRVTLVIREGGKERQQAFQGTVIARKGTDLSESFTLHRVAYGVGMERTFLLHSPRIVKIEVIAEGDVRRAKLYHLRGTQGKKSRVRRRLRSRAAERQMKAEARGSIAAPAAEAVSSDESSES